MRRGVQLWTDEEVGILLDNPKTSADELAEMLGRSRSSIYAKRVKLSQGHVSSRMGWTEDEDDFILDNPGMKARVVAEHLGRAKTAVDKRRQYLSAKFGISFDYGSNKNPHEPGDRRLLAKTCPTCGLLLDASWFGLNHAGHGKGWRKECTRCRPRHGDQRPWANTDTKALSEKLQAASIPAPNHGKPWLEADHAILADPDLSVIEKARRLGRTYYATMSACTDNGYRSRIGKGDPMKGVWVIDNPNDPKAVAA